MKQSIFTKPITIKTLLLLGLVPLLLFPADVFELKSQEWWLPAILVVLSLIGTIEIIRKSRAPWPMFLVSFAHGFNIISRLLMFMPQSTQDVDGATVVNSLFLVLSIISMAISAIYLWYVELPQVKQQLAQ